MSTGMSAGASAEAAELPAQDDVNTGHFESEFIATPLPEFVWAELENLYSSVYASRLIFHAHAEYGAESTNVHVWIERKRGAITALLLFQRKGPEIWVLNEVIALSPQTVMRFAKAVFDSDSHAHLVRLHAIALTGPSTDPALWQSIFSEDYVLELPSDYDQWMAGLSRQTREKLRYHLRRSFRRQPDLEFTVQCVDDISDADVRKVLRLNQERMNLKGRVYGMSDTDEARLSTQMQSVGMLCALKIEGEIFAGLLCSAVGSDIYMHVIAHDPRYDDLRLGLLCCCLTIRHAISREYARFHFLWGHYEYKRKLGGQPVPLSRLLVRRNAWQSVRHPVLTGRWLLLTARDSLRRWRQSFRTGARSC